MIANLVSRSIVVLGVSLMLFGCSSHKYSKTVESVDLQRFMGKWYVWSGRTTFLERGAHNAIEIYSWNRDANRIDVDFSFRKDRFDGELKRLPQKAWIENKQSNAHWKIQLFWPFKADYLVIALDKDYQWTAIGVPSGDYLWIMGRKPIATDEEIASITKQVEAAGYPVENLSRVPQDGK